MALPGGTPREAQSRTPRPLSHRIPPPPPPPRPRTSPPSQVGSLQLGCLCTPEKEQWLEMIYF